MDLNEHYTLFTANDGALFVVNRHDYGVGRQLIRDGAWGELELKMSAPYAQGVVLDVGANIGTHAIAYAKEAYHVYAFEPQPMVFNNLCANLMLNDVKNVTPICSALGTYDGEIEIPYLDMTQPNSSGGIAVGEGNEKTAIRKLDSLPIVPNFIKIDVEKAELDVLSGAVETLSKYKPVVWVEFHSPQLMADGVTFMETLGYKGIHAITTDVWYDDPIPEDAILQIYHYLFLPESQEQWEQKAH